MELKFWLAMITVVQCAVVPRSIEINLLNTLEIPEACNAKSYYQPIKEEPPQPLHLDMFLSGCTNRRCPGKNETKGRSPKRKPRNAFNRHFKLWDLVSIRHRTAAKSNRGHVQTPALPLYLSSSGLGFQISTQM